MDTRHRVRRSEEGPIVPGRAEEAARLPVGSKIEAVPGYKMPIVTRGAEAAPAGATAWAPAPRRRVVDAALGSRKTPHLETVIGQDDRVRVRNIKDLPWRAICALRITAATGGGFVGTGWFIDPRTVVTAGHCVFMRDHGGWVRSIEVIPALDRTTRPFGSAIGTRFRAVDGWIQDDDRNYDYGAILLDEDLGSRVGSFRVAALDDAELTRSIASLAGYPADRDDATRMYYHARRVNAVSPFRVSYEVDTYGGQSGSPIWLTTTNDDRTAVAIHTTGDLTSNSGTRLTAEIVENLNRWSHESTEAGRVQGSPNQ